MLAVLVGAQTFACSSSESPGDGGGDDDDAEATTGEADSSSTAAASTGAGGAGGDTTGAAGAGGQTVACAVEVDPNISEFAMVEKCIQCCATNHPDPSFTDALTTCACTLNPDEGPGACWTNCKSSFCAATPTSATPSCTQCLYNAITPGGDCVEWLQTECQQRAPDCSAHLSCLSACHL